MNDTIYRQDAIDAFDCTNELIVGGEANAQNVVNYINRVVGKIKDLPSAQPEKTLLTVKCEFDDEELRRAIEDVKNAELELITEQRDQRWIPVSERLPEKNGRYLVTNTRWGAYEVDWNVFYKEPKEGWIWEKGVTAWMPLPEPYKEEK